MNKMKQRIQSLDTPRRMAALAGTAMIAMALAIFLGQLPSAKAEGDGIGSLPKKWLMTIDPTIVVEGDKASVLASVGRGLSKNVVVKGNTARATFSGFGLLSLDRASVAGGKIRVYMDAGPTYAGGVSALVVEGRRIGWQLLPAGLLDLALDRMERSGLLDESILDMHNFSPTKLHRLMRISASGPWIQIDFQP